MAMGRVFSSTRPALPLMGQGLILINGFENFFKTQGGLVLPHPVRPTPIIMKLI